MGKIRIVSLIASSTEMVYALGCGADLVGRSHECDYPPSVKLLPQCTETRFKIDVPSREIDRQVKEIVEKALSVYKVNANVLKSLRPDVMITQTQCAVCAVSLKDVEAAVCNWLDCKAQIVSLETNGLADLWTDIDKVANALRVPRRGKALIAKLQAGMAYIDTLAKSLAPKPRIAYVEWIDPLMAGGNWMPELIERAGGVNLFGHAGKHSPQMRWEELVAADPDIIVVCPCGFDIPRTRQEMPVLVQRPEWQGLQAVKTKRVYLADGNAYFNRPGPRLLDSLEILAEIIHPELFYFGREGTGWVSYS